MTSGARRAAARSLTMTTRFARAPRAFPAVARGVVFASLGVSTISGAAPVVGEPRVLVTAPTPLAHGSAIEALVGNGADVFGAYVQSIGGNRTVLRGSFFVGEDGLTPETPTGIVVSGSLPRDTSAAAATRRPALAMNGLGTVLGAYANDVFRVGRDGSVRSLALTRKGAPAAASFPPQLGPQAAVLLADPTNSGTFLFAACAENECTLQRLGDDGAPIGAEATLFSFAAKDSTPMIAGAYVPGQGFRLVAAQKQQILTAVVTADAIVSPSTLEATLAPACEGWIATSVRVGRGATADTAQTRITTSCDSESAAWVVFEGLAVRTEPLCGAAAGIDDCQLISSDAGLFVAHGAALTAVATGTARSLAGWVAPLRGAPGPTGALLIAANTPALSLMVPETVPVAGSAPWRTLSENGNLYSLSGSSTPTGDGPTFRAGISRGAVQGLIAGEAVIDFPEAIPASPIAVTALDDTTTFVATNGQLVRITFAPETAPAIAPIPFAGLLGFGMGAQRLLAYGVQSAGPFLYSYGLQPAAFDAEPPGALPNLPAVAERATLLSLTEGGTQIGRAFDGTHHLVVFTRQGHLDGVLLDGEGALLRGPFSVSAALYAQSSPQVTALAGGGFFVVWTDARTNLQENDIYGTFVGADGAVSSPQGIPIARTALHEIQPYAAPSGDPDHVLVVWSEYPTDTPRSALRVRGAAVSQSAQRARSSFSIEAGAGDHYAVGLLSAGATGVTAYLAEQASPIGGNRVLARYLAVGKAAGAVCTSDAECLTDACVAGVCAEPPSPPSSTCGDPCATFDATSNTCVPVPRGTAPSGAGCPGYVCNGSTLTCPTRCQSDVDCSSDAACENEVCVVVRSCVGETDLSDRGVTRSCGPYRCDPVLAACLDRCTSKEQCATGLVCDEISACVPPPAPAEGGCSVHSTDNTNSTWILLGSVLGVLTLARRKKRLAGGAALALGLLVTRDAYAADPRVGAAELLPTSAGSSVAMVVGPDTGAMTPLGLPGASASSLFRVSDRGGAFRDAVLGPNGFTAFQPAIGTMNGRTNCEDGSVLALERTSVAGRPRVWLLHYTDGPVPTHRILVPDTVNITGACTSDGAWIVSNEATDVYERYVWTTGARAQRVETLDNGTVPFFAEGAVGWVVQRGTSVFVLDANRTVIHSFVPYVGARQAVLIAAGSRALLSFDTVIPDVGIISQIGVARASATAIDYVQDAGPALTAAMAGTLVPRARTITYRSGTRLQQAQLPDTLVPVTALSVDHELDGGGTNAGYVRGERYELTFQDGTRREFALADLSDTAVALAPVTALPRALRLASSAGTVTRLLGYEGGALAVFRQGATTRALTLPAGTEGQTLASLSALPDGRASLTTRDAGSSAGHVLSTTDDLAPFPAVDAATAILNLGDGVAVVHFTDVGGATRFTLRHISATVGETALAVDVPPPTQEWGLRNTASLASVGNVAFAVFARGVGNGEQHLDWSRIEQGAISEPKPLTRAFLSQHNPKIACDPRGVHGCLVAWEDYRKSAYDADVYIARILAGGSTPDGDGIRLASSPRSEGEPSVIWADDDDHFFVAWRDAELAVDRKPGVDPSRLRGAFVRYDGTIEDPDGIELTDEPLDEMAPILLPGLPGTRGTFRLAYQVFVSAVAVGSNQIALRTVNAGKLRGEDCSADAECAGRACIDGICCEASCADGCGTCNQPNQLGVCVPRADGAPSYQDRCGSYLCDGTSTSCPAICRGNEDCTGGSTCAPNTRQCTGADGTACQDDGTQVDDAGATVSCAPYRCVRGRCAERCLSNAECAVGSVCTPNGRCEATPAPAEGGCSTSGESPVGFGAGLGALLLVVALGRRKSGAVPS